MTQDSTESEGAIDHAADPPLNAAEVLDAQGFHGQQWFWALRLLYNTVSIVLAAGLVGLGALYYHPSPPAFVPAAFAGIQTAADTVPPAFAFVFRPSIVSVYVIVMGLVVIRTSIAAARRAYRYASSNALVAVRLDGQRHVLPIEPLAESGALVAESKMNDE